LYDAVHEASRRTQVIVTTQSADFLDSEHAEVAHIIAVKMVNGATRIGPIDDRTRDFLTREPSRLAELHRQGQLDPAPPHETPSKAAAKLGPTWSLAGSGPVHVR
jgi:hypothetical protein